MPAPVFQAVGTQFAATNATTATWPTHQTNDIGLLVIETDGIGTAITISGWNSWINVGDNTVGTKLQILWKRAASNAEPSVSIPDSGDHQIGAIFTFRGCRVSGSPVFGTSVSTLVLSNGGSITWPSLSVTEDNSLVLLMATRANDNASTTFFGVAQPGTGAALTGVAEAGEVGAISGNGGGATVQYGTLASAGASGEYTSTVTTSAIAHVLVTAALLPPVSVLAAKGSFTVTGNSNSFKRSYVLSSNAGIFTVNSNIANLKKGIRLTSSNGSFSIIGKDAILKKAYSLISAKGSFLISGNSVSVRTLRAGKGSVNISGKDISFKRSRIFTADYGSFNISGVIAGFTKGRIIATIGAQYSVVGKNANLIRTIDPQQNLNNYFPSAIAGDAVVDENTGNVWIYDGFIWVNSGETPGLSIESPSLVPVYNEIMISSGVIYSCIECKSLPYKLDLEPITIPSLNVSININVFVLTSVSQPTNSGKISLQSNAPSIRQGAAVTVLVFASIAINKFSPSVSASSGIGVPSSVVTINKFSPFIFSLVKSINIPSTTISVQNNIPTLINISDQYWSNVILLVRGEGLSTTDNTKGRYVYDLGPYGFKLWSSNPGNVYSSSRKKFGDNSLVFYDSTFDATFTRLNIEDNAVFTIGTGAFTVEAWLYPTTIDSIKRHIIGGGSISGSCALTLHYDSSAITLQGHGDNFSSGKISVSHNGSLTINNWHHIAVCRGSDGNVRFFLNGQQLGSTVQFAYDFFSPIRSIGSLFVNENTGTYSEVRSVLGFLEDIRITKAARYLSGFSLPTEPYEGNAVPALIDEESNIPFSAVKLQIHGYGSNNSTNIIDSSQNSVAISPTYVTISSKQDPFGLSSGVLSFGDAEGYGSPVGYQSYLTLATSSGLIFGTQPFCMEFWVYLSKKPEAGYFYPLATSFATENAPALYIATDSSGNGIFTSQSKACPINVKQWHHVAYTRDQLGEYRIFVDGVKLTYPSGNNALVPIYASFTDQIDTVNRTSFGDPYLANVTCKLLFDAYDPYQTGYYYLDSGPYDFTVSQAQQSGTYGGITNDAYYGYIQSSPGSGSNTQSYAWTNSGLGTSYGVYLYSSQFFNDQGAFALGYDSTGSTNSPASTIECFFKCTDGAIYNGHGQTLISRGYDFNIIICPYDQYGTGGAFIQYCGFGNFTNWTTALTSTNAQALATNADTFRHYLNTDITLNTWHHIAITTDGNGNMFIWYDGKQVAHAQKNFQRIDDGSLSASFRVGAFSPRDGSGIGGAFRGIIDSVRVTKGAARYTGQVGAPANNGPTYTLPTFNNMYAGTSNTSYGLNGYLCEIRVTKGYARYIEDFTVPNGRFFDQTIGNGAVGVSQTRVISITGISPSYCGSRPVIYSLQQYSSPNGEAQTITWPAGTANGDYGILVIVKEGDHSDPVSMPATGTGAAWNYAITEYTDTSFGKYSNSIVSSLSSGSDTNSSKVYAYWTKANSTPQNVSLPADTGECLRIPNAFNSTYLTQTWNSGGGTDQGPGTQSFTPDKLGDLVLEDWFIISQNSLAYTWALPINAPGTSGGTSNDNFWSGYTSTGNANLRIRYAKADSDGSVNDGSASGFNAIVPIATGNSFTFTVKIIATPVNGDALATNGAVIWTSSVINSPTTASWVEANLTVPLSIFASYVNSGWYIAVSFTQTASGGGPSNRRALAVSMIRLTWSSTARPWAASFAVIKNVTNHVSASPWVWLGQAEDPNASFTRPRSGIQRISPGYKINSTATTTCTSPRSYTQQLGGLCLTCFITPVRKTSDAFTGTPQSSNVSSLVKHPLGGVDGATADLGSTIQFVSGAADKIDYFDPIVISKTASSSYIALSWVFDNDQRSTYTLAIINEYARRDGKPLKKGFETAIENVLNLHSFDSAVALCFFAGCDNFRSCMFTHTCYLYYTYSGNQFYNAFTSNQTWVERPVDLEYYNLTDSDYDPKLGLKGNPANGAYVVMPNYGDGWFTLTDPTPATSITAYSGRGECVYGSGNTGQGHSEFAIRQDNYNWNVTGWSFSQITPAGNYVHNNIPQATPGIGTQPIPWSPGVDFFGYSGNYLATSYYYFEGTLYQWTSQGFTSTHARNPWLFGNAGESQYGYQFSNARVNAGCHANVVLTAQTGTQGVINRVNNIKSYLEAFWFNVYYFT